MPLPQSTESFRLQCFKTSSLCNKADMTLIHAKQQGGCFMFWTITKFRKTISYAFTEVNDLFVL